MPDNSFTTFNTDGTLDPWAINYAPPVPLNIEAGTTQTFAGDVSLRGNVGDRLSISSTSDGDRFNVEFEGDSDISYVNVKDSSNTYGPPIIARRSTDGHNNVGWIFGYQIVATHNGSGAVYPSDTTYSEVGDSKTFTITPSSGNSIADVFVDGSSVGAVSSYVFSDIVSDHTISATFVPNTTPSTSHKLNISATEGGNVSPSGKVSVKNGASVVVTATPKSGYYVNGYSSDAKASCMKSGVSSICTISNITADKYFMAKFARISAPATPSVPTEDSTQTKKYNIYTKINSIGSKTGGRIDSNCSRTPSLGDVCRYDFIPSDNFKLKEVVLDGKLLGWLSTYTIDGVSSDHTIEATFIEQYEVSIVDQDHLTIETNDDSSAEHGDDYTFTIKADDGFAIKDVLANGVSIKSNCVISGDEANCTIKNVMSKQSIGAVLGASDSTDEQDGKNNAITAAIGLFILPFTSAGDVLSTTFKSMPKPIAYTLPWLLFILLAIVTYMIIKYWKKRIGQRN